MLSRKRGPVISEETVPFGSWDVGRTAFQKFGLAVFNRSILVFLAQRTEFHALRLLLREVPGLDKEGYFLP